MDAIQKRQLEDRLSSLLIDMPKFVIDFFGRIYIRSIKTRIQYYYDLKLFLTFLVNNSSEFKNKNIKDLTYDDLNAISLEHIDKFVKYITYYKTTVDHHISGTQYKIARTNSDYGISRKIACLKSFYGNLYKLALSKDDNDPEKLKKNLAPLITLEAPKLKEKYRMKEDNLLTFLDETIKEGKGGEGELTKRQKKYIENNTHKRDLCIIYILAETGIRVEELVGINIKDIDFETHEIKVLRKGNKEDTVYYEASSTFINEYYEIRKTITPLEDHKDAFFLSIQRRRIGVRAVEKLIEKYGKLHTNQQLTPHVFRRSFATNLYEDTRDIYLVASMIGDTVQVATKHYTRQNERFKRDAISKRAKKLQNRNNNT